MSSQGFAHLDNFEDLFERGILLKFSVVILQNKPTVFPADVFDSEADAQALRKAMKGWGCNNEEIVNVLAKRSANQRVKIEESYKSLFGRDLIDDLKDELGGNFERLVLAMMLPWPQVCAKRLHKAAKGVGTDEDAMIDVLCTANNCQIKQISEAYKASKFIYPHDLWVSHFYTIADVLY